MHKPFLITGAVSGAVAVILGAFGAHGLRRIVTDEQLIQSFQTGVQYQMYHSLALIATAIVFSGFAGKKVKWAGIAFISGIILFSGSLYLITFLKIQESNLVRFFGPFTPLGGILFIAGWALLAWGIAGKRIIAEARE